MFRYLKSAIARLLAIVSQFALIALIGRELGADATGTYASAFSFASMAAILVSLGQMAASVKEIPTLLRVGDRRAAGEMAARAMQITVLGAVLFALPLYVLGTLATGSASAGLAAAAMGAGLGLLGSFGAIARSFGSVFLSEAVRNVFWRLSTILLLLPAGMAAWQGLTIEWLLAGAVLGMLVSLVASAAVLSRWQRLRWQLLSTARLREGLRVDLNNWLLQSAQSIILNVDVVLVGVLIGLVEAGVYFVLSRMASLLALPLSITNPVILPAIGRVAKGGTDPGLSRAVRRNAALNIGSAGLLALALLAVQDTIFELLSSETLNDSTRLAFAALLLSQAVNTGVGPTSFASQLFDVRARAMKILMVCLAGLIVSLVLLSRAYGLPGAAFAVAFWRIAQNLLTFELIRRRGGFNLVTGGASSGGGGGSD